MEQPPMSVEAVTAEKSALASLTSFRRFAAVLLLGFASGMPLALTTGSMQAWRTLDGVTIATIGFFGLVGIPYTFKFVWAPLMDRFELPFFGRRRGWVVL
jgi:PAT family beta-lactamase induction signal transducer AmpG